MAVGLDYFCSAFLEVPFGWIYLKTDYENKSDKLFMHFDLKAPV
jgi:hypothetical protein